MHQHNRGLGSAVHPTVTVAIDEQRGRTYARVELYWGAEQLAGSGVAYRHPADHWSGERRQELATARALSDLADQVAALCRAKN